MHPLLLLYLATIFCLVPVSSIASAAYLASYDKSGWGWFLVVGVATFGIAYDLICRAFKQAAKAGGRGESRQEIADVAAPSQSLA